MQTPSLRDDAELRRAMRRSERSSTFATLGLLRRELGLGATLGVLGRILASQLRGEPFGALPPPEDRREVLSRRQAAPVVQLYHALRDRLPEPRAYALTRESVLGGGVVFLGSLIGDLDPREAEGVAPGALEDRLRELVGRFFNAEGELRLDTERSLSFEIRRCRFPELLRAVGEERLAPLFCEVDRAYFTPSRTPIRLRRSRTLAAGEPSCDFRFEW